MWMATFGVGTNNLLLKYSYKDSTPPLPPEMSSAENPLDVEAQLFIDDVSEAL